LFDIIIEYIKFKKHWFSSFTTVPEECEENQLLPLGLGQIIDFQAPF
jgi:hypothetical protein